MARPHSITEEPPLRRRPRTMGRRRRLRLGALTVSLCIASFVIGACGGAAVEWGYAGEGGPERWSELSEDYLKCKEGTRQSPIDISGYAGASGPSLFFDDGTPAAEIEHDDRLVVVHYEEGNSLDLGGRTHHLKSLHAHVPSEHTIDGESFALELHMVHADDTGALTVVSRLYRHGDADSAIQTLIDAAPEAEGTDDARGRLDPSVYVPDGLGYYRYTGSKTTPPCNGPVDWLVMAEAGTVSVEQAHQVSVLTGGVPTNRPIQPTNDREITRTVAEVAG